VDDHHPIAGFMKNADEKVKAYEEGISRTFKETVNKYRRKYGRHPPPGFRDWYKFAREKGVYNIDDFEQVMDDIRPFWGVEPSLIRKYASTLALNEGAGLSGCYIRDKKIWKTTHVNWRMENFHKLVEKFVKYLPDMDIVMNRHDQPRVTVPWDDLQALLKKEEQGRRVAPEVLASWSTNMTGFYVENANLSSVDIPDPKWTDHPRQQYMNLAKEACPPDSPARNPNHNKEEVEASYKDPISGLITNFNKTSDLCVIGPEIQDKHGFLFSAATLVNSKQLLPIFGECKVNVNNDILFPANMYYNHDTRYFYNAENDYNWDDKHDTMLWRGVTSGGTGDADNWRKMHRQRLQLATNGTELVDKRVRLLKQEPEKPGYYTTMENFNAGLFMKQNTDVAFTAGVDCIPARSKDEGGGCPFYDNVWTFAPEILLAAQFRNKYLIDVDGASFSGRWRAFLQSKSLGLKATIFREWHDSRLFAWKHFVPVDHRYDDIYSILTYFIGLGKATEASYSGEPYVQRHDFEGRKIANQGREWASKVLRDEDIEVRTNFLPEDKVCRR